MPKKIKNQNPRKRVDEERTFGIFQFLLHIGGTISQGIDIVISKINTTPTDNVLGVTKQDLKKLVREYKINKKIK